MTMNNRRRRVLREFSLSQSFASSTSSLEPRRGCEAGPDRLLPSSVQSIPVEVVRGDQPLIQLRTVSIAATRADSRSIPLCYSGNGVETYFEKKLPKPVCVRCSEEEDLRIHIHLDRGRARFEILCLTCGHPSARSYVEPMQREPCPDCGNQIWPRNLERHKLFSCKNKNRLEASH